MPKLPSTPPNDLREVNRVLYINLGENYDIHQRRLVRKKLTEELRKIPWESIHGYSSSRFHKRNDGQTYSQLAGQVQDKINELPSPLECRGKEFTVSKEDVPFEIFVPMPRDAEVEDPTAFTAGFESLRIDTPKEEASNMLQTTPNALKMLKANRLLYINLAGDYDFNQQVGVQAALQRRMKNMNESWIAADRRQAYLYYKINDSKTYAELEGEIQEAIESAEFNECRIKFNVSKKDVQFEIFVPMPRDVVAEEPAVEKARGEEPTDSDSKGRNERRRS
ncbi:hypothetical protein B9Z55_000290 [Caenorhabditis nigoni]|uniref:Uncharacterized protein n=1 Tax=Caenorhabditis nigoni TaxID=1611254 RepID=A0A2G5VN72_9PELO|nr:hypothetical protein B9Z55_000290 [Caenorhabditis nigoni]